MSLDIRILAHSWLSDWNHGNAHFLRGWAGALQRRGHRVRVYEGVDGAGGGWSLTHLRTEPRGAAAIAGMRRAFSHLDVAMFAIGGTVPCPEAAAAARCRWVSDWGSELRGADLVVVHEWNPAEVVHALIEQRRRHGFRLLLFDTHHRAISQPETLRRLPLRKLDAVLAFGESLRRVYETWGARRTYTLHEAADTDHFGPMPNVEEPVDVVWIGNWGDEERSAELREYLLGPAQALSAKLTVYGVRYPAAAVAAVRAAGGEFGGYLANLEAPAAYAAARMTAHIPRRPYAKGGLSGIPTIRMFEALACGAALISAPWRDEEKLFEAGEDYWTAGNGAEAQALWKQLLGDATQRKRLGQRGAATIRARHTCAHRAVELEAICSDLG